MRLILLCIVLAAAGAIRAEEKTDKPADQPAASPADDAKARAAMAGLWKGFTVEGKGDKPDQGPVKMELTITEKTIHGIEIKMGERLDHGEGEFTLDLKSDPKQLDASRTNERGRKQSWVGIYKLEGDTLYWCVGTKMRPTTFETVKGQFLLILKREAKK